MIDVVNEYKAEYQRYPLELFQKIDVSKHFTKFRNAHVSESHFLIKLQA